VLAGAATGPLAVNSPEELANHWKRQEKLHELSSTA
jgi:hypothetical protein